jgi:hypothetical protein
MSSRSGISVYLPIGDGRSVARLLPLEVLGALNLLGTLRFLLSL